LRTSAEPWDLLGEMLLTYLDGDAEAAVEVVMEDRRLALMSGATLVREEGFPPAEAAALDLARGRVLDVGAGAGAHALELAARGLAVTALEISPGAVAAMRRRGVADARHGDLFAADCLAGERFDTVLLMMNGLGLAGDLEGVAGPGLGRLLLAVGRLLAPGGAVLVDSCDLRFTDEPAEQRLLEARREAGRYFGAVTFRIAWKGVCGPEFPWLFLDPDTLERAAGKNGWRAQVVFQGEEGDYLARLVPG